MQIIPSTWISFKLKPNTFLRSNHNGKILICFKTQIQRAFHSVILDSSLFRGKKKGAKNVTEKSDFYLSNPKPGLRYRFYKEICTRERTRICTFKPSNTLFRIPHSHTFAKGRARHQGTGADLGGFKGAAELTGRAFHPPQCPDSLVDSHQC